MGIFRKQPGSEPSYCLDDLRSDIGKAIEKARAARIHPIEIERGVPAIADWQAQRRAGETCPCPASLPTNAATRLVPVGRRDLDCKLVDQEIAAGGTPLMRNFAQRQFRAEHVS